MLVPRYYPDLDLTDQKNYDTTAKRDWQPLPSVPIGVVGNNGFRGPFLGGETGSSLLRDLAQTCCKFAFCLELGTPAASV